MPAFGERVRRHVLINFIGEKLLSEAVETGNVTPNEAIFCKFGNIVTSITFVMSSLSCNAMLSSGFLACEVQKVIHSVCTSGDMTTVFTLSSSFSVRATYLSRSSWTNPQLTFFHKWEMGRIGTGNITRIKYGQCWHKMFPRRPINGVSTVSWNVWNLSALTISSVACWSHPRNPKFLNPACCWSNGIVQYMENCERRDHGQIKLICLKTFAEFSH